MKKIYQKKADHQLSVIKLAQTIHKIIRSKNVINYKYLYTSHCVTIEMPVTWILEFARLRLRETLYPRY